MLPTAEATRLAREAAALPGCTLGARQLCDLELLLVGAYSPLTGFLGAADHASVCERMRLADGRLWPIPVVLDVSESFAATLAPGATIALRDGEGVALALLDVQSIHRPDRQAEAHAVYGSEDPAHPGVAELLRRNPVCLGGRVRGLSLPRHHDFPQLRHTPAELRAHFQASGHSRVVAFQTRNPIHRAHFELTLAAARAVDGHLLLHPAVGPTRSGDVDHATRVRCYQAVLPHYPEGLATLSLLPLAMRMAGPREALWHALIRRQYGAAHFIVGRDHAGPGNAPSGQPWYPPLAAQELLARHADEIGLSILPFPAQVYAANRHRFMSIDSAQPGDEISDVSGTELRGLLERGEPVPAWYTFPEVAAILRERYPPAAGRGAVVFFTGLSGAGKSTLAQALAALIAERCARAVTLLDGDEVRRTLSKGLGFSRGDRDANIERIAWVAAEIARHRGLAIAAPIAPYAAARARARRLVEAAGAVFLEVHVATPIEVCEARDPKGLYAQARAGKLSGFTGIDDPYEAPEAPDLRLDASSQPPRELALRILERLEATGVRA